MIECSLSPENLTCDGELTRTEVNRKLERLNTLKAALDRYVGYEVALSV